MKIKLLQEQWKSEDDALILDECDNIEESLNLATRLSEEMQIDITVVVELGVIKPSTSIFGKD